MQGNSFTQNMIKCAILFLVWINNFNLLTQRKSRTTASSRLLSCFHTSCTQ